ncbi:MDM2-binding protein N-terminal domain, partial [Trinorchestia longiramus]
MDKNIVFICSELQREYFTSEVGRSIRHLKDLKEKKHPELAFVNLCSIVIGGNTLDGGSLDTNSGHAKIIKHCLDEEDPLVEFHLENQSANNSDDDEEFKAQEFLALADCLHQVADGFGEAGSYVVYVIWCIKSYIPDAGEVCEVFAALHRLQLWHNACVAFVTPDPATVAGWPSALPLMVSCDAVRVVDDALKCMWRGDILYSVQSDSSEDGEELVCVPHVAISCLAGQAALVAERQKNGRVFVAWECEVVSSIQLSSLPPLFLRPGPLYSVGPVQDQLQPVSAALQHTCTALQQLAPSQQ